MRSNITLKNFENKIKLSEKKKLLNFLNKINNLQWPGFLRSYKKNYIYSYDKKFLNKYQKFKSINIIGMGGSSLGTKAIYSFLRDKIKKKFFFFRKP